MTPLCYDIVISGIRVRVASYIRGFGSALETSYGRYLVPVSADPRTDQLLTIDRMGNDNIKASARPGFGDSRILAESTQVRVFVPDGEPTEIFITHVRPYLTSLIARFLWERQRVVMLHASAWQDLDGKSVIFVGPSGAGKTSTALTRVADGARFLCNDIVLLRPGINWHVLAMPQPPTVGHGFVNAMASAFPDFSAHLPSVGAEESKKQVRLADLPGGHLETPLKAILFVHANTTLANPFIEPCQRQESFARLMGEVILPVRPGYTFASDQLPDGYERLSELISDLAKDIPATLFTWTSDPVRNALGLAQVLDSEESNI